MMVNLAVIDRDGVIADVTRRLRIAQKLASYDASTQTYSDHSTHLAPEVIAQVPVDWSLFFQRSLMALDEPITSAPRHLMAMYQAEWMIRYLTSTPEHLAGASQAWMLDHGMPLFPRYGIPVPFVHKPPAAQYLKTAIWKVLVVVGTQVVPTLNLTEREVKLVRELERQQALTKQGLLDPALYDGEEVNQLMVVDDEPRNRDLFADIAHLHKGIVPFTFLYASLEEALTALQREE